MRFTIHMTMQSFSSLTPSGFVRTSLLLAEVPLFVPTFGRGRSSPEAAARIAAIRCIARASP